jgi:hypothetical protein
MQKWEYSSLTFERALFDTAANILMVFDEKSNGGTVTHNVKTHPNELLNRKGKEGWEMVAIAIYSNPTTTMTVHHFKRPIEG